MTPPNIKQLKLVTGEELLAEILEEDETDLIVKNTIKLVESISDDGYKYYSFRNFMIYQDDPESVILLKVDKIVSVALPIQPLLRQYNLALIELEKDAIERSDAECRDIDKEGIDTEDGNSDIDTNIIPLFH